MNTVTANAGAAPRKPGKRKVKRIILSILGAILAIPLAVLLLLMLWSPGKTSPILDEDGNPMPNSVSEIVRLEIGGVEQGMILKGESDKNPVLLFLHGGPGSPEYMMDVAHPTHLEKEFTVCWWDQRGSGMSFNSNIPKESMTLEQLVADTIEVTNYLRTRFSQEKIYIMGHSWGSFLGMHVIVENPDLYEAFIGIGQVVNQLESEKLAYAYMLDTARKTGDTKLAQKLEKFTINTPEDLDNNYMAIRTEGMNKQGIGVMRNMNSMFADFVMPLLRLPEYTLADKVGYARGALNIDTLWESVPSENLMETIPSVEVPVYIIQGKYDYQVSHDLAKAYSQVLEAPEVLFYTFENSAHSPCFEEPELFMSIMRKDVLKK